jgi:hypothetical protein
VFDIEMRESQIDYMTMHPGKTASNLGSVTGGISVLVVVPIGVTATDRNAISSILEREIRLLSAALCSARSFLTSA